MDSGTNPLSSTYRSCRAVGPKTVRAWWGSRSGPSIGAGRSPSRKPAGVGRTTLAGLVVQVGHHGWRRTKKGASMTHTGAQRERGQHTRWTGGHARREWWGRSSVLGLIVVLGLLALGLAPAQAAPFAYIKNWSSNTVSVLDTATTTVVDIEIERR